MSSLVLSRATIRVTAGVSSQEHWKHGADSCSVPNSIRASSGEMPLSLAPQRCHTEAVTCSYHTHNMVDAARTQPLMWLYEFAAPNTAFDLGSRLSDWLQVHPWDAKWNTMFKMVLQCCGYVGWQRLCWLSLTGVMRVCVATALYLHLRGVSVQPRARLQLCLFWYRVHVEPRSAAQRSAVQRSAAQCSLRGCM